MTSPNDSATARRRIVILSDLHLSIGTLASVVAGEPPEFFFHDEPLAALIDELWDDGVDTLLLLGDLFELPGGVAPGHLHGRFHDVHIDDLVGRLDRIVAGHKPVFEALGRYLARGGRIDLVGRYGGDEFIVLFANTDLIQANQAMKRLAVQLETPIELPEQIKLATSFSIGFAVMQQDAKLENLIRIADQTMYKMKKNK